MAHRPALPDVLDGTVDPGKVVDRTVSLDEVPDGYRALREPDPHTTREPPIPGWTPDELAKIEQADELELASQRRDGSLRNPVTMWVVRDGDELYVRSMHGRSGAWFRGTQARQQGHIRAGGVDKDVAFVVDADPAVNDRIDAGYRSKYRRYGANIIGGVVNPESRASTIKLVPR